MITKRGVSLRKFLLYSLLSMALFLVSGAFFYIFNIFLFLNLFLSNLFADLIGLFIGFYISKEKIFFYEPLHRVKKLSLYMFLRFMSILFFSTSVIFFHDLSILFGKLVDYSSFGLSPHFITKFLMAPFSLFLNFLISFFAIEFIHCFFSKRNSKSLSS